MKKSNMIVAMLAVVGALTIGKMTATSALAQDPTKRLSAMHGAEAKQQGGNDEKDNEENDGEEDLLTAPVGLAKAVSVAAQHAKGYVNEAGLENENGKLIWSIRVVSPDGKQSAEVEIDATSGSYIKTTVGDGDGEENDDAKPQANMVKEGPQGDGDGETNDDSAGEARG